MTTTTTTLTMEDAPPPPLATSQKGASRRTSSTVSFQMFKDLEAKEEFQKLKLAGFLRDLHKLAKEECCDKVRESLQQNAPQKRQSQRKSVTKLSLHSSCNDGSLTLEGMDLTTELTPQKAKSVIDALLKGAGKKEKLDTDSLIQLAQAAVQVMGQEPTVIDLREHATTNICVVGDLHGSLRCLQNVLKLVGLNNNTTTMLNDKIVVFDGDYVDRGHNSLEVLCTLLLLKLAHPKNVYLLRGNHEDTMTASIYGFREELDEKYEDPDQVEEVWYEFGLVFAALPICARSQSAVILHGGIPYEGFTLDRLAQIDSDLRCQLKTVVDPYDEDEQVVQGCMWSDPTTENGIHPNDRGGGAQFGPDITKQFLDEHSLKYIIRAHEPFEEGTDHLDLGDGRGVVTIFSTSNYPNGEGTNLGAILYLDDIKGEYHTVGFNSDDHHASSTSVEYQTFLRTVVHDNRHKLCKAFRAVQDDHGHVTPQQWATIVALKLELPDVEWLQLQPELAPLSPDGSGGIDWTAFVNKFTMTIPKTEVLEETQLNLLHQHKDKFLNIFKLLDIDGSGTINKEEFVSGIETLNEQTTTSNDATTKLITNAEELFHVFDEDGNGEISIEEFCQGIERSATLKSVTDSLDATQVETLQENHEMLLLAFKYLDTDKSGAIDRNEFRQGMELLNKRLDKKKIMRDPEELFDLLDADGNGEIDLNEFNQMFVAL